jgi:prepilin-type N-terminal cleavage/methylation domain-containing protein
MRKGFSLIELSIVLVILGLLTGGILAGQSLIRASELRAVSTEYSRYITVGQTFRDKYFALPGDFRDATRFWNRMTNTSDCVSNSGLSAAGTPGACDGNGDGVLGNATASLSGENVQFWRQLALAGLIEGTYTGQAGSGGPLHFVRSSNVPASKLGNAMWGIRGLGGVAAHSTYFTYTYNIFLQVGGQNPADDNYAAVFKPEEVWNIDMKMDDGKPGRGKIMIRHFTSCTDTTDPTNLDANYLLTSTSIACAIMFPNAF